jgi:hypothetical protein
MMSSYQETTIEPALFASMTFLSKEDRFLSEKPYRLTYNSKNIPRTNVVREVVHDIPIWDLREVESTFTFEKNGIAILEHQSSMTYEDFSHPAKIVERYCTEIAQVLLEYMRADHVYVFDYNVRCFVCTSSLWLLLIALIRLPGAAASTRLPKYCGCYENSFINV